MKLLVNYTSEPVVQIYLWWTQYAIFRAEGDISLVVVFICSVRNLGSDYDVKGIVASPRHGYALWSVLKRHKVNIRCAEIVCLLGGKS